MKVGWARNVVPGKEGQGPPRDKYEELHLRYSNEGDTTTSLHGAAYVADELHRMQRSFLDSLITAAAHPWKILLAPFLIFTLLVVGGIVGAVYGARSVQDNLTSRRRITGTFCVCMYICVTRTNYILII